MNKRTIEKAKNKVSRTFRLNFVRYWKSLTNAKYRSCSLSLFSTMIVAKEFNNRRRIDSRINDERIRLKFIENEIQVYCVSSTSRFEMILSSIALDCAKSLLFLCLSRRVDDSLRVFERKDESIWQRVR